ncbi:MAG TPA: hypothetical protein PKH77_26520 [Anaerolineae bacterium]|nr:hypothetical protein [Anaerolineae bacterium]
MLTIKRPLFMCGENPGLRLFAPQSEQPVAVASYWHCTHSALGPGRALVLWLDVDAAPDLSVGNGGIFSDNMPLAHALVEQLTQYFAEFQGLPVTTLPYVPAICRHSFDGRRYQVTCQASQLQIALEWCDLLDQKYLHWPQFPAGAAAYDLTTVICPCQTGQIAINEQRVPGNVQTGAAQDGAPTSTAFLAFAESWVGPAIP